MPLMIGRDKALPLNASHHGQDVFVRDVATLQIVLNHQLASFRKSFFFLHILCLCG
jgi:hypothetical protein